MKAPKTKTPSDTKPKMQVSLDYVSPESLRTSYLTGLFAAPTPEGSINVVGYVERKGFPERTIITASADGSEAILEDVGEMGWVREIQSSFLISASAAQTLIEVLQEALGELQARQKQLSNKNKNNE